MTNNEFIQIKPSEIVPGTTIRAVNGSGVVIEGLVKGFSGGKILFGNGNVFISPPGWIFHLVPENTQENPSWEAPIIHGIQELISDLDEARAAVKIYTYEEIQRRLRALMEPVLTEEKKASSK